MKYSQVETCLLFRASQNAILNFDVFMHVWLTDYLFIFSYWLLIAQEKSFFLYLQISSILVGYSELYQPLNWVLRANEFKYFHELKGSKAMILWFKYCCQYMSCKHNFISCILIQLFPVHWVEGAKECNSRIVAINICEHVSFHWGLLWSLPLVEAKLNKVWAWDVIQAYLLFCSKL